MISMQGGKGGGGGGRGGANFLKLNLNESLCLVKECHFVEEHVGTGALHCR